MTLPLAFVNRIQTQFPNEWKTFLDSIEHEPVASIRHNPRKSIPFAFSDIPWSINGKYEPIRSKYTLDPKFHGGAYYVQESSSMFLSYLLQHISHEISLDRVLDLCAAPGGKSTIILDQLEEHQFLISNEILPNRNLILKENLTKWGYPNFLITENKPKDFEKINDFFDVIVIDAPCSGEGLFRKDKNARLEWSENNAAMCSERQLDIVYSAWNSLKPGGFLVYSTCTYNPDENENVLIGLRGKGLKFDSESILLKKEWNIHTIKKEEIFGYQFLPHKVQGEGFFCSVLRKKGAWVKSELKNTKSHINPWLQSYIQLEQLNSYSTYKFKNSLFLAPNHLLDEIDYLRSHLYIKQIGIEIGTYQGTHIEVHHGLTMLCFESTYPRKRTLTYEQAISYLTKSNMALPLEDGLWLLSYQEVQLGWIQIMKNKIINHYPNAWKIRTSERI